MATYQLLDRLHQIQNHLYNVDDLESTVASERLAALMQQVELLIKQRSFLREERRLLRLSSEANEERRQNLTVLSKTEWMPASYAADRADRKVKINISGLMFELPVKILQRDPGSLLCRLCDAEPPLPKDVAEDFFYFDRDWWLFRYIAAFLRDGVLPDDRQLLAQLYRECAFWKLSEMQKAIEEEKLHLRPPADPKKVADSKTKPVEEAWWKKLPSWYNYVPKEAPERTAAKEKEKAPEDWWTDTTYKGKVFLPISALPEKVVTKDGEKDAKPTLSSTYSIQSSPSSSHYY